MIRNELFRSHRRGAAMLLVLIALMLGTILTSAYLFSRDNSAAIGANVAASTSAKWAASSGLDFATTLLQTEANWRTLHTNGKLLENFALAGGTIDIDLLDLATNAPPTAGTEDVRITVTGIANGVRQAAVANVFVSAMPGAIDLDLSEFAIFATDRIRLADTAKVTRWPKAPLSDLGMRIKYGTRAITAGSVEFSGGSATIDTTVFKRADASSSLISNTASPALTSVTVADPIPMPNSPDSGVSEPFFIPLYPNVSLSSSTTTLNANRRANSLVMTSAVETITGNRTIVSDTSYVLGFNSKMIIDGHVKLVVFGDLALQSSSIELEPGSTLQIWVRNMFIVDDSYIGDIRADAIRDNSGNAAYSHPERVEIYGMALSATNPNWYLTKNSVIKGSIYAPRVLYQISDSSALYGRVAAHRVSLDKTSALFYDHALDRRLGYANSSSSIYQSDGRIKPEIRTLSSLDPSLLASLIALTGGTITTIVGGLGSLLTPPPPPSPIVMPPGATSSPRPNKVTVTVRRMGPSIAAIENAERPD